MTDGPTLASLGGDGRPVECTTISNPSSTLPLLYDLDALSQIPVGEFTKDIPPTPIGEFTKPRKSTAPTNAGEAGTSSVPTNVGEAGPSSVPDGVGDQDEESDDASSCSDDDDEDDPRPRRGAGPLTLEENLRGERAFIEDLLDEDKLEDPLNMEAKSTLKQYTSWIYHYKRWAAKMLKEIRDKLSGEERMRHVDEIGHWIHCNKSKDWDNEKVVRRKYIWLHGPRVTETRLRAYIKFLRREYKIDAETNAPVKSNMVHMILGHIKACLMAARVEATLYKEKELGIMREISVVRSEICQFHGLDLIQPVDTSTHERWYKKHLFFVRNDEEQMELPAASHQQWMRPMWKTNGVFSKRNIHAARAGGAQELAIDGTSRAEIAKLGHWAIDKMTRAYITAIPVDVVMKKAGYSGAKQDYILGRNRVEPGDELLALIAEHIFPSVDDLVKKVF
ncbi:unnamed protein product [Closterium sp. NIES-64]|nr:unnamed protein product [Closterium sp. NIES-64]